MYVCKYVVDTKIPKSSFRMVPNLKKIILYLTASGSGINFVSGCEFHGGCLLVQLSFSRSDFLPSGNPHVSGFVVGIFGGNVDLKMKN